MMKSRILMWGTQIILITVNGNPPLPPSWEQDEKEADKMIEEMLKPS